MFSFKGSNYYRWRWAFVVSKGKEFTETHMGKCGSVVWFIDDVQLRGFPSLLPNVPSTSVWPWKKFNVVFSRPRLKATSQSLCSILKYSPIQHPASLACVPSCSPLLCLGHWGSLLETIGHMTAKAMWLLREQVSTLCKCRIWARERASFFLCVYNQELGFGTDQVLTQNGK